MPRICLCVIARDEAPRIARLLASVAGFVDEAVVADTGSRDGTAAIARAHGARVIEVPWADDFAHARNACLEAAAADWHLVLDADEWLVAGGDWLTGLGAGKAGSGFVGRVEVHNLDADTRVVSSERLSRLLLGAVRYAGCIHEQPVHQRPLRDLPLRVAHDGYSAAAMAAKRGRNRTLLRRATAEHPDDAYLWYQLGKDCAAYEDHADAEPAFARAAALMQEGRRPPWWPDLVLRWLYVLQQAGRLDEALALGDEQSHTLRSYPDLPFTLGNVWLDVAVRDPARAGAALARARACWEQALRIGERPGLEHAVAGRGSAAPRHNLGLLAMFDAG
ncbi:MAG: glycosyltransferase family 2 protein [Rubrivivax sp.]|nr:glycosyltransferase family 2 protein [Rubrivivax sp.]